MTADDETIRVYDARAEDYARCFADPNKADPLLEGFLTDLPPRGRILDLGCGPGTWAARMAQRGFVVDATDASAEMVRMAADHPGVTAWQATFDDIPTGTTYQGVWANFSLLHARRADMPRYLGVLHSILEPGGILHIAVKTGHGEHRDRIGRLYSYYTEEELTGLLEQAGFTLTARQEGADKGLSGDVSEWISLRAHA